MQIGIVGLGKMGLNMAKRLLRAGHEVVGHDPNDDALAALEQAGGSPAAALEEVATSLGAPRAVWVMVPAGDITRAVLTALHDQLGEGDVVVDGGNSDWREDAGRAEQFAKRGVHYVDAGVSGGVWGLENGYCLMVGGPPAAISLLRPALESLAPPDGFAHVGPVGAGHYAKMVHNAIEYGMMESLAEGFEMLHTAPHGFDLAQVADVWRHGSVVRSWLLDLAQNALTTDPGLSEIVGYVPDSGEGRWAVETAIDQEVPAFVFATSVFTRFRSRQDDSFAMKVLAALRREFGGHAVKKAEGS